MGRRGCASAMGMIKFPSSCSSPKALCNQFIDYYICSRGVFCINHIVVISCNRGCRGKVRLSIMYKSQIARFMGPAWGPPGSCRPQMGPVLAPRTLLSGVLLSDQVTEDSMTGVHFAETFSPIIQILWNFFYCNFIDGCLIATFLYTPCKRSCHM